MKKAVISMILIFAIVVSIFSCFTVTASAASNTWSRCSKFSYYDAGAKAKYEVTFYYKENYKKTWNGKKDYYISQMKVVYDCSTDSKTPETKTLKSNSNKNVDTCMEYLKKYYKKTLYKAYVEALEVQEIYRNLYIQKKLGHYDVYTVHKQWCNYIIDKYVNEYAEYATSKSTDTLNEVIKETFGFTLPESLQLLGSVSSIKDEIGNLKDICVTAITDLYRTFEFSLLASSLTSLSDVAYGPPVVKDLYETVKGLK